MAESRKVTTLRLPEELHDRVAAAAEAEHRSLNNFILRVLDETVPADSQMVLDFHGSPRRSEAS